MILSDDDDDRSDDNEEERTRPPPTEDVVVVVDDQTVVSAVTLQATTSLFRQSLYPSTEELVMDSSNDIIGNSSGSDSASSTSSHISSSNNNQDDKETTNADNITTTSKRGDCNQTDEEDHNNIPLPTSLIRNAFAFFVPHDDIMPLPTLSPGRTHIPSYPGAFFVSENGNFTSTLHQTYNNNENSRILGTSSSSSNAGLVEMGENHQIEYPQQQERELTTIQATESLAQAWPVADTTVPVMAAPHQEKKDTRGSGFTGFKFCCNRSSSWACLMLLLSIIAGVLVAISFVAMPLIFAARDPYNSEHMQMKETILDAFGKDYFDNPQKEKALHWIIYDDPRNSLETRTGASSTTDQIIQRFSLASFYYQTSSAQQQAGWGFCNPPTDEKQSDNCFYVAIDGRSKHLGTRWLTATHECQWMGVSCNTGPRTVSELYLSGKTNLTGTIPVAELAMLTDLEVLQLPGNSLTGSLPLKLFEGTRLRSIWLTGNSLSGKIPPTSFTMPSLSLLRLDMNKLSGSIPPEVGRFSGEYLALSNNLLSGPIPEELYKATNLQQLFLDTNLLTGTLSSRVGSLKELTRLNFSGTSLGGSICSEIGLLNLDQVDLSISRFQGTIPEELYKNSDLKYLIINGNQLSGTISTRIGLLKRLEYFDIADNKIHGAVPKEVSKLTKLTTMHVNGNSNLTGSIPDKFCSHLRQRSDTVADCSPTASTGFPAVFCPQHCCSTCCDAETGICFEQ